MLEFLGSLYNKDIEVDDRVKKIVEESKTKVSNYFGLPRYLFNSKLKLRRLPELYEMYISRIGGYIVRSVRYVGKILGMFNPEKNEIYIDPINLSNENLLRRSILHEFVHKGQEILGKIYRVPRYLLEREARVVAQKLI